MKFTVIATGKCKNKNILSLEAEYQKRISAYGKLEVFELNQSKAQGADEIKNQEAQQILAKIPNNSYIIALDERGEMFNSLKFAGLVNNMSVSGTSHICLIIGGAEGLADSIKTKANKLISLSGLTFPHMLVRVLIAEQIYRCLTINNGHPYHRE